MRYTVITEEDLVAYLDGGVDAGRRREIEAARVQDQRLAARLAALNIDTAAIRATFDAVAAAAPVERLRARLDEQAARPRRRHHGARWVATAAAAAALMMATALGYVVGSGDLVWPARSWHVAIADYQALYTGATLAAVPPDPVKQRADVETVAARLGLPIRPEALQVPGLEFKRAQILSFKGRPLAQFAYVDQRGEPVAFCATPTGDRDSAISPGTFRGLDAAFWSRNGYGFILIGRSPSETLRQAAAQLAKQI
jgi:anti-sigma factor RsiW